MKVFVLILLLAVSFAFTEETLNNIGSTEYKITKSNGKYHLNSNNLNLEFSDIEELNEGLNNNKNSSNGGNIWEQGFKRYYDALDENGHLVTVIECEPTDMVPDCVLMINIILNLKFKNDNSSL
ncbi:MAG: hypothetical protein CSA15_09315 [Candidatus Delongbacteria bacterium]|nr:MAG: hypothetical protein CSA15_09315 [Candidatus Delongbacteria bacterium]